MKLWQKRGWAIVGAFGLAAALVFAAQTLDVEVSLRPNTASAKSGPFWLDRSSAEPLDRPLSFADLADALSPAVVNVQVERSSRGRGRVTPEDLFEDFFGRGPRRRRPSPLQASGSGFVISEDGFIVTNDHVVEGADEINVVFQDGAELVAKVIGRDPKTDLALVKVDTQNKLPVAPLGDSDQVRVGDWVMAIGNPFGLDHTVTVGILSARGRNIQAGPYDDFLQTDASINPGNSGGPLIDREGRVIGINTAINAAAQGIGFAIPINMAKDLLPQLREAGHVTRGWLGVQIQKVSPALAESFHLDDPKGALVSQVFDESPAAKAKIRRGDVIVEFNDRAIEDYDDLPRIVASTTPGSEVPVIVLREGKRQKLSATLEKMPDEESSPIEPASATREDWGFNADDMTPRIARQLGLEEDAAGPVITDVERGSPAAEAGLRRGDRVLEINRKEVKSAKELEKALDDAGSQVVLLVQRDESTLYLAMEKD